MPKKQPTEAVAPLTLFSRTVKQIAAESPREFLAELANYHTTLDAFATIAQAIPPSRLMKDIAND